MYIFRSCNRTCLFLVLSLVQFIKENYKKMELSLSHTLRLFYIFREYDEKENCAQVLEEELHRMLGMKYVNDEFLEYP